jgi:hypothetical protein
MQVQIITRPAYQQLVFLRISEIANCVISGVLRVGDIYQRQEKWRMIVG